MLQKFLSLFVSPFCLKHKDHPFQYFDCMCVVNVVCEVQYNAALFTTLPQDFLLGCRLVSLSYIKCSTALLAMPVQSVGNLLKLCIFYHNVKC